MYKFETPSRTLPLLTALFLGVLVTGCGGGGQVGILGGGTVGTVPAVTSVTPTPNATGVALNNKIITAAFTKPMDVATLTNANFSLACPTGTPVTGTTIGYVAGANLATMTLPVANLPASTVCTATIASAVRDSTGYAMGSNFTWSFSTGPTLDTTAPMVSGTSNANGATNVPTNTKVGATFSEAMDPSTITTTTFTFKQGVTVVPGTLSYSGVNAIFTPTAALAPSTVYTATVTTAAKDTAGNAMASNHIWSWTTSASSDTTAPRVTATIHANGATNVATNTNVGATFSENMDASTITNANFILKQGTTVIPGTLSYSGVNAVFNPLSNLAPNTLYSVTVKGGTTGVADLANNRMTTDYVISWTTAATTDTTAPTVTSTNPAAATTICINKSVNATFSEAMDPLTVSSETFTLSETAGGAAVAGLVSYDSASNIATFKPTANLAVTTGYTATIKGGVNGAKDSAGNALAVDKVVSFTTNNASCTASPALGAAAAFGGFGGNATLTNDGLNTIINGDTGVNASSTTVTGLRDAGANVYTVTTSNDGKVNGVIHTLTAPPGSVAGAVVTQARADALVAFNALSPASMPGGIDVTDALTCATCGGAGQGPGQLAGRTLPPGVYLSTTGTYGIGITVPTAGNLTLDGGGDANAVWVFQTAAGTGTLTVGVTGPATPATPIQVLLINGASAKNVFWYAPGGASIGTGSTMAGTILSDASITLSTTGGSPPTAVVTTLNGRAIALTAGVTMTNSVVNVPAP